MTTTRTPPDLDRRIAEAVQRFWGFDTLRPLQHEAIRAGLDHRDAVVVMPTGGGKSLCYQVPPIVADRVDVVVSPLISLMKDQVDGLRACGYPATAVHSGLPPDEREAVLREFADGRVRLLFVSPERLVRPDFQTLVERAGVMAFAIDEAHCISHWGHDFRPEYRQLGELKTRFPGASVHAFTATATPRVQRDIAALLCLDTPQVLVGGADRPNLVYRIVPRLDTSTQVLEVLGRHAGEAAIVYCLARRDTESIAAHLESRGIRAAAYHAGMSDTARRRTQEAFAKETLDVVVATVAFGMGIDRSNVRCVVHASMPQSVEHYQQETGRAGRDGLEAECVLLYSAADALKWEYLMGRPSEDEPVPEEALAAQLELLRHMQGLCATYECRHRALSRYFGQTYDEPSCDACDVCLGEVRSMDDSTVVAQKILSCVARVNQQFGVGYVVQVLRGAATDAVRARGHDHLSTYGLLADVPEKALVNMVYQLVDQGMLMRTPGDRPVLRLTPDATAVLRGGREVQLREPRTVRAKTSRAEDASWEGVDRGLFDALRELRREIAAERAVPAYVVFDDRTLREMAARRPTALPGLAAVRGVGEKKLADFGPRFVEAIASYCAANELESDLTS